MVSFRPIEAPARNPAPSQARRPGSLVRGLPVSQDHEEEKPGAGWTRSCRPWSFRATSGPAEGPDLPRDPLEALEGQLGVERDLDHLARQPLRDGQVARPAAGRGHRRLQVDRPRVVDGGRDPARGEVGLETVAVRRRAACRGARPSAPRPARAAGPGPAAPSRSRRVRRAPAPGAPRSSARGAAAWRAAPRPAACRGGCWCPSTTLSYLCAAAAVVGDLPHARREVGVVRGRPCRRRRRRRGSCPGRS